jgi:cob(I)alamin adenosyltransferase
MMERAEKALDRARDLGGLVRTMIPETRDLDLQRLLKQIDADLMDIQHKLSMAVKLSVNEGK